MVAAKSIVPAPAGKAGPGGRERPRPLGLKEAKDPDVGRRALELLGPMETDVAGRLRGDIIRARGLFIAAVAAAPGRLVPSIAERKLKTLENALSRGSGRESERALEKVLDDHGAQWLLCWASGEATQGPEGNDQDAAEKLIRGGRHKEALPIVAAARARAGKPTSKPHEGAASTGKPPPPQREVRPEADRVLWKLGLAYFRETRKPPTRGWGDGGQPSLFEQFLEAAIGDLAIPGDNDNCNSEPTLGKRWERAAGRLKARPVHASSAEKRALRELLAAIEGEERRLGRKRNQVSGEVQERACDVGG